MLIDDRLKTLQKRRAQKSYYESRKKELEQQRNLLERKVYELKKEKEKEDTDVEKLEGKSLLVLFYEMTGSKEEKLSKEKQEAYAANLKYEASKSELEAVEYDILSCIAELRDIERESEEFERLIEKKKEQLKENEQELMSRILHIEGEIAGVNHHIEEIRKAIKAGDNVRSILYQFNSELSGAEDMATFDLFTDSTYVEITKHDHIKGAKALIGKLQSQLRCFRTELVDIEIDADIRIDIDEFAEIADWFYDNIFIDLDVRSKIKKALKETKSKQDQIEETLAVLKGMLEEYTAQKQELETEIEAIIVNA